MNKEKIEEKTEDKEFVYVVIRLIEVICIGVFLFGSLWEGTEILKLSFPEFMMLYGGVGAIISEVLARLINKQLKKK